MEDRVITLQERRRAETAPPRRNVSIGDLIGLLDRHPVREAIELTPCRCGECDWRVERRLFDLFADDDGLFQTALRSEKSRREALFELRDALMQRHEVRSMLADPSLSRRSIITGVHKRAATAAWLSCFELRRNRRSAGYHFRSILARARHATRNFGCERWREKQKNCLEPTER